MIKKLFIQNYAIIDELGIQFSDHLTTITGETGAGKSILMGALSLILGDRADTSVLFEKEKKCIVEGTFDLSHYQLQSFFESHELDYDDELILRREIKPSGKSRAFINDSPVLLSDMKALSNLIIDIHRQFDTLDINDVSFQLNTLDALAEHPKLLSEYREAFHVWKEEQKELETLVAQQAEQLKELDFLRFQLNEIEQLELSKNELAELQQEQEQLAFAEELREALGKAQYVIEDNEHSISSILAELLSLFERAGSAAEQIKERIESAIIELEDIARESGFMHDDIQADPGRLELIENRLSQIYNLLKKHQLESLSELLDLSDDFRTQIQSFESSEDRIQYLQKNQQKQLEQVLKLGKQISKQRAAVIPLLETQVQNLLKQVAMPNAIFKVHQETVETPKSSGIDEVKFLFTANKGGQLQPIKNVASGGELSRLALCIKSIVAAAIPLPTLIFDEIDSGVSGDVSLKMGKILHDLSRNHQVTVITHSPQISAMGDRHYFVYKETDEERTFTKVKEVEGKERIKAVAVMLSSDPPTEAALDNAKELLSLKVKK